MVNGRRRGGVAGVRRRALCVAGVLGAAMLPAACGAGQGAPPSPAVSASPAVPPMTGMTAAERVAAVAAPETQPVRGFRVQRGFLTMSDGVRLSVSYYMPSPRKPGERLPVVLSAAPYRKDDEMLTTYYSLYPYFARRGIVIAQLDLRGSGASEGLASDREYSDAELDDLEESVGLLAAKPWSNGSVGMMGKSWAGFNAIMTAMRRPPALKAILVAHASEDLYRNDIHSIDGALHLDIWALEMEAVNIMPRHPAYRLDDAYFRERFDREPWALTYLRHQRDGEWWQKGRSLQSDWSAVDVPVYCIGALLDGYRDYVPSILDHVDAPVWAEIGPWNHAWPHDGWPKPQYEWRRTAVRWWRHWLTGDTSLPFEGKTLTVFQRGAMPPGANGWRSPGRFVVYDWPLRDAGVVRLVPRADRSLDALPAGSAASSPTVSPAAGAATATHELRYAPSSGIAVGGWWGEITGDMRSADEGALVYDSAVLADRIPMLGNARVQLDVAASASVADWFVRLEDVWPDGRVSLVTGGGINGAQRESTSSPKALVPGEPVVLRFPLHFSTYTFKPGHRIRLAVTNALFPMIWPSAEAMTTTLSLGDGTCVDLPTAPPAATATMPSPVAKDPQAPDAVWPTWLSAGPYKILRDDPDGITAVSTREGGTQRIGATHYAYMSREVRWVDNRDPARAGFRGSAMQWVSLGGRRVTVRATVRVVSDATHFHVTIRRVALQNGSEVRRRTWSESIPRDFQ